MSITVKTSFTPAHELLVCLYTISCRKMHKRIDLGTEWIKDIESEFPKSALEKLFDWDAWATFMLLAWICPEKRSVEGFLGWLEQQTPGQLFEHLSPWMTHFPLDLRDLRNETLYLLNICHDKYFKRMNPLILQRLDEEARQIGKLVTSGSPLDIVEQVTNGLRFENTEDSKIFLLIPQYHAQPLSLIHAFHGLTMCHYAASNTSIEEDELPVSAYRVLRALSDRTRLRILRFLKDGPKPYMEIVHHLGMTKSTVYEHLLTLRGSGLLRAHIDGEHAKSYSLRMESLDNLHHDLVAFLQ